jgi:RND family efflux transporter MFP subunit
VKRVAALLASCVVACGGETDPVAPPAGATEIVRVEVAAVAREQIVEKIVGTGTIAAHKTTDIGPRVSGVINEIPVKVGDRVEEGAVLFRTRSDDYEIRARQAAAQARIARAALQKLERDVERIERLQAQGVASVERLDDVRTAHETALAQNESAQAGLAEARQNLEDTIVRAPYPGVITRRYVDEGAMMSTLMSAGSQVVQIMKIDIVAAIVQVPGVHLPRIRLGTPARVTVDGVEGAFESEVYILNDRVDHESRAVEIRLPIRNPDYRVKPGLFARAELIPEPREAVVVPQDAVLGPTGFRYVFVDDGGVARRREVRVQELDTRRMEVVDGLAPGDAVLTGPNLPRVSDGTKIATELAHADR